MFVRSKKSGNHRYLQIVENHWEDGHVRQRVIGTLGREDELRQQGKLEQILCSLEKFADHALVLTAHEKGEATAIATARIGPPLIFERLWSETCCGETIETLVSGRKFGFSVERAVFLTVLHRLVNSGSDRFADKWHQDYKIENADTLSLHHLYRAMAWLGEELLDQKDHTHSPRTTKDMIEEELFHRRRDLFASLSVVFFDTTSLYFEGEGGETLGEFGFSKDHRPDRHQMVLGVIIDEHGRPICSEMWPGNTADVTALLPVIDRLRNRFRISRMCVLADCGMICQETIDALDERKIDYILGARERSSREIQDHVLPDTKQTVPLSIPRGHSNRFDLDLQVRETVVCGRRYITCINAEEAAKDASARAAIVEKLKSALKQGDKALLANKGYRRYLKTPEDSVFEIDPERIKDDERLDGVYILRTNTKLTSLQVANQYRQLWKIEKIFHSAKTLLVTRPIFHQRDATIRGHVFCSFLALILRKELEDRLAAKGLKPEWADILLDLDRLQEIIVEKNGKRFRLRTATTGICSKVFNAVGVALPPTISQIAIPPPQPKEEKVEDCTMST